MKRNVLFLASFISLMTHAQDTEKLQPCMEIKKACENAGYQSGLQKGKTKGSKGQVKECMRMVTNGETVSGVKLGTDVLSGCKEKHEK